MHDYRRPPGQKYQEYEEGQEPERVEPASRWPGKRTLTEGLIHRRTIARLARALDAPPEAAFDEATSGSPGEVPFRAEMETAFSEDFSGVKAYVGRAEPLEAIGAAAAAHGERVAFGSASPDRETVAHELTHVVQHRRGGGGGVQGKGGLSDPGDASEREADVVASQIAAGGRVTV